MVDSHGFLEVVPIQRHGAVPLASQSVPVCVPGRRHRRRRRRRMEVPGDNFIPQVMTDDAHSQVKILEELLPERGVRDGSVYFFFSNFHLLSSGDGDHDRGDDFQVFYFSSVSFILRVKQSSLPNFARNSLLVHPRVSLAACCPSFFSGTFLFETLTSPSRRENKGV